MSYQAASGIRLWVMQRLSAVYMVAFVFLCLIAIFQGVTNSYADWHDWVAHPIINATIALFFLSLLIHAWVGMRDIIMDYVKPFAFRFSVLVAVFVCLVGMGVWVMRILVSVTL